MFKVISIIISIIIPNLIGFLGGLLGDSMEGFKNIIKPSFTPPGIVFPIVWTILFTLMGISSYLIYKSNSNKKKEALTIYFIQLLVNSLWSLFFFRLEWFLFSFFWIILIIILVIIMIYKFYKINKTSAYLQIPYLLWLIFAGILNFNIFIFNR